MAIIEFEGSLGVAKIRQLIGDFDKNQSGDAAELVLHFQPRSFIEAGALAQLTSWLLQKSQNGYSIKLAGDNDVVRYLGRMGVQAALGLPEPEINKLPESGRFIPLMLVNDGTDVFNAVSSIADIVLQQFDGVGAFLDAFEWSVNEIVDNVFIHAQSSTPGVVCAQLYPTKKRLDIAVCDSGVGIKETLSQSQDLKSHSEALEKALQRGVTRDVAVGQGNGMAGSMTILKKNGGKLLVWSGDALFRMEV